VSEERRLRCAKCDAELVTQQYTFGYMNRTFGYEVPVCPRCGRAYISRELAEGKMAEVEILLEDK
jgi:hypothetical protein